MIASLSTPVALYEAQSVGLTFTNIPSAEQGGEFYAIVDPPSAPPHPAWHECRTDNNTSTPLLVKCQGLN